MMHSRRLLLSQQSSFGTPARWISGAGVGAVVRRETARRIRGITGAGEIAMAFPTAVLQTAHRTIFSSFRDMVQQSMRAEPADKPKSASGLEEYIKEIADRAEASLRGSPPHGAGKAAGDGTDGEVSHIHPRYRKLIRYNPNVCPRSALFIPGHKPRALQKALSGAAPSDCFILDLEDSVGPASKREAREGIRHFIETDVQAWREEQALAAAEAVGAMMDHAHKPSSHSSSHPPPDEQASSMAEPEQGSSISGNGATDFSVPSPRFIVRINSPDDDPTNALLDLDLVSALGDRIEGVGIPKVTPFSFDKVKDYLHPAHHLWAFFETPQSVMNAMTICQSGRYRAAVMGYNDLSTELRLPTSIGATLSAATAASASASAVDSGESASSASGSTSSLGRGGLFDRLSLSDIHALRQAARYPLWFSAMQVLYAARAAPNDMFLLDGVFNDPTDPMGFAEDLRHCFALGFQGKTLIHPSQVRATNAIFTPSVSEVEWAREVQAAVAATQGNVASVRGKMVEGLHVRQAQRLLLLAESAANEASDDTSASETPSSPSSSKAPRSPPPSRQGKINRSSS